MPDEIDRLSASSAVLSERLSRVETQLGRDLAPLDLSETERSALVDRLRESIERAASEEFLEEIRTSVKERQTRGQLERDCERQHTATVRRLDDELLALSSRGNLNLSLGVIVSVGGMAILAYFIFTLASLEPQPGFSEYFIPRLSLVAFVEVFAYFFLRLYSSSLVEIKYFQNEITNIETRFFALKAALYTSNEKSIEEVIRHFAHTERNFVLQKGQTTAEIEHWKTEKRALTSFIPTILGAFSRRRQEP